MTEGKPYASISIKALTSCEGRLDPPALGSTWGAPPCVDAAHEGQPRVDGKSTHTDFMNPAILLYEPQADGSLKLVGVENLVFMHPWQKTGNHAPPMFAGRVWNTMADNSSTPEDEAHRFEPHHDQHIYFKKMANPKDQLMPFSPNVTCKHHKGGHQAGGQKK